MALLKWARPEFIERAVKPIHHVVWVGCKAQKYLAVLQSTFTFVLSVKDLKTS